MASPIQPTPDDDAVIRVYNYAGNVIETHEHKGDFKEPQDETGNGELAKIGKNCLDIFDAV